MVNITNERLEEICQELIKYLDESINDHDDSLLALKITIGMSEEEIKELAGDIIAL